MRHRREKSSMSVALVCWAAALLTGCATLGGPPQAPCQAWVVAEAAWVATDATMRQQLAAQRALACMPTPEPPPTTTAPEVCERPADVVLTARKAQEQQPLPGATPRQE